MNISLSLNERPLSIDVPASATLLEVLRQHLGLFGAKHGGETGECGACTVLLDGRPVNTCVMLAAQADGHRITTIESIGEHPEQGWRATEGLDPIQQAFVETGGGQAGGVGGGGGAGRGGGGPEPAPEIFRTPPLEPVEGGGGGPEVLTRAGVLPRMQVAPRLRPWAAAGKPARQGG